MEENKKVETEKESKKLSYEKLEALASQLSMENRQLMANLRKMDNMVTRLNFLMEIHKYPEGFSKKFVEDCNAEIEDLLTIPEEETKEETKE